MTSSNDFPTAGVELRHLRLIEQAYNFYLKNGCFPSSYEEMQTLPVLKVGILPLFGFANSITLRESSSISERLVLLAWLCSLSLLFDVCFIAQLITQNAGEPLIAQIIALSNPLARTRQPLHHFQKQHTASSKHGNSFCSTA
jgi:hypothetical protein